MNNITPPLPKRADTPNREVGEYLQRDIEQSHRLHEPAGIGFVEVRDPRWD
jgi:hypothetical protein